MAMYTKNSWNVAKLFKILSLFLFKYPLWNTSVLVSQSYLSVEICCVSDHRYKYSLIYAITCLDVRKLCLSVTNILLILLYDCIIVDVASKHKQTNTSFF